jgi:putative GTP pyrophosphokinase
MIDQEDFFAKYRIETEKYEATDLEWHTLEQIHDHYRERRPSLEPTAELIASCLRQVEAVHSLRVRLKDPERLIAKIVRKRIEDNSREISVGNYGQEITDLIGIRALHLFKEDWPQIHSFIVGEWELAEEPIAYIREGDPQEYRERFREEGCTVTERDSGYRSVHYLVVSKPTMEQHIAEVQVRTLFEEGWSEIDHRVRYPYDTDNPILNHYLVIFNRLAGQADEMGSFVRHLKHYLEKRAQETGRLRVERDELKEEVKERIRQLEIEKAEKESLEQQVEELSQFEVHGAESVIWDPAAPAGTAWLDDRLWGQGASIVLPEGGAYIGPNAGRRFAFCPRCGLLIDSIDEDLDKCPNCGRDLPS